MFALLRRCVEAIDVVAGGVVQKIGLGRGYVVAKLPMSVVVLHVSALIRPVIVLPVHNLPRTVRTEDLRDWYSDWVKAFLRIREVMRFRPSMRTSNC